ncbi:DUF202 domain-containing protein [Saccharopolyspora sp. 7B]|uniref:DUF202 domain-containing protein n=1 Tax=Saccharopolyspora sp. 7B TaxID=2877240 RepID=UPI001CD4A1AC|nr:DUF202 domain-containing protein [Saccharopolyspora sp. 7B]MCA1188472.1 DUF202 domain-containing protein [Saccharopolyspora sp. 6T]MCA1226948.1 DUF202 domain-containing protein [Saccharopolyspora sp. 6M]MCA1282149.1 DUF202 domain-containing protein [Saccharopolyspora sp. 7B]
MLGQGPWDPGLQVERTTLAWLRTGLTFVVGLMVLLRLLAHRSAVAAAVCAAVALPLAAVIAVASWRRHRQAERNLRAEEPLPDGVLQAAFTALALLAGAIGAVYVLLM